MDWIVTNWQTILLAITSTVTAASVWVKLTPTPKDDEAVSWLLNALNFLAINKPIAK